MRSPGWRRTQWAGRLPRKKAPLGVSEQSRSGADLGAHPTGGRGICQALPFRLPIEPIEFQPSPVATPVSSVQQPHLGLLLAGEPPWRRPVGALLGRCRRLEGQRR